MAEAHQFDAVLTILDLANEGVDASAGRMDFLQHLQHSLIGAAMKRAEQRIDTRRHRCEEVGMRGADQPHRRGRAVLLVVGVQEQQHVQGLGQDRVDDVVLCRHTEGHAQEVVNETKGVVGVHVGLPDRLLVGVGGQRGQFGEQPDRADLHLLRIEGIQRILIEGRQGRDGR